MSAYIFYIATRDCRSKLPVTCYYCISLSCKRQCQFRDAQHRPLTRNATKGQIVGPFCHLVNVFFLHFSFTDYYILPCCILSVTIDTIVIFDTNNVSYDKIYKIAMGEMMVWSVLKPNENQIAKTANTDFFYWKRPILTMRPQSLCHIITLQYRHS